MYVTVPQRGQGSFMRESCAKPAGVSNLFVLTHRPKPGYPDSGMKTRLLIAVAVVSVLAAGSRLYNRYVKFCLDRQAQTQKSQP